MELQMQKKLFEQVFVLNASVLYQHCVCQSDGVCLSVCQSDGVCLSISVYVHEHYVCQCLLYLC